MQAFADLGFVPHPEVWALILGASVAYLWAQARWGPSHVSPSDPPVGSRQMASFFLGVAAVWFAADWPLHDIGEQYLFSVHMIQHMVFWYIAPPLLLMGMPEWMLRRLLSPAPVRFVFSRLARPVPALLIFNAVVALSHWPPLVNLMSSSEPVHAVSHGLHLATATLMWWPVLGRLAEFPRLRASSRLFYLFLQTVIPTVPASFLTFSETPLYQVFAEAPRAFGLDALTDQRMAGLVMKLGGGLLLWGVIAVLFFRWSSREERGEPDPVDIQDLEVDLNEAG